MQDVHFPKAGMNVVCAFGRQPPRDVEPDGYVRSTPLGVNVRGYDARQSRFRGGSRSGIQLPTTFPSERLQSVPFVTQELRVLVTIGADPDTDLLINCLGYYKFEDNLEDSSGHNRDLVNDPPPVPSYAAGFLGQGLAAGAGYTKPLDGLTDFGFTLAGWFYAGTGTGGGGGSGWGRGSEVGQAYRISYRSDGANGLIALRDRSGVNQISTGFTLTLGQWYHAAITYNGTTAELFVNGVSVGTYANTLGANWSRLTFGANATGSDFTSAVDELGVWSRPLSGAAIARLYNSGSGLDLFGGGMELSQSGRVVALVAVCQGTVKVAKPGDTTWTTPTNNTGETPALNYTGLVYSAPNQQKLFFVDGINYAYYNPATNSVEPWIATAGTLPTDTDANNARLICTWRGRTVLSGLLKDPQNVFMSRVSDPFDFDYAPVSPSPADAVAFNASDFGLVGDAVTALIPFSDDVMVIGCDHSIYLMRGDPAAGGQLDLVTRTIGIAWGEAWTQGPDGTIYFMSNRCGIYALTPGAMPVRISQSIEPLLQELNMGGNIFRLAWNDRSQSLHVFVTWVDEPRDTDHFTWEQRTQAWWIDRFSNKNHNPLCCVVFDGNSPDDRQLLLGCWDGYVRKMDPVATDDDGSPIESEVWLGPILTKDFDSILLKDLQGVLGEDSGEVTYSVHVGDTAEQALASDAWATGTLAGGRNFNDPIRGSGHAIYVKLSSTSQWAMEAIRLRVATQGKMRRRIPPGY